MLGLDEAGLTLALRERGWILASEEVIRLSRAGEGNMNLVLRVQTDRGSYVLKRAAGYVEKYPSIAAPVERSAVEARFYELVGGEAGLAGGMPRLLGVDGELHWLWLEDLGAVADCRETGMSEGELAGLLAWLAGLHRMRVSGDALLENRALRALNFVHVFELPFGPMAGLDAWIPGLQALAERVVDERLREEIAVLGAWYLSDGPSLLHGDMHLGSVVRAEAGLKVLDPEFAYLGWPSWDLGVLVAHLVLGGWEAERALVAVAAGYGGGVDARQVRRVAGVELLRRLLGVARLPGEAPGLGQAQGWLALGRGWVLS